MKDRSPMMLAKQAAALTMFVTICGCASFNEMAENFEKRWDNPNAVLAEMSKSEPLSPEAQATLRARLEEVREGEDCSRIKSAADQVLTADENNVMAHLALGDCDLRVRNLASAKTHFEIAATPGRHVDAIRGLGVIATLEGRSVDAEGFLREAADKRPDDWRIFNALGYAFDQQDKWQDAEIAFRRAAELNTQKGAPLNNIGMSYLQQKRYVDAATAFREALAREPELETARLNLRIARALDGNYADALVGANDTERAVVLNNIGVAAMARGDLEEAKRYFRAALDEDPIFYSVAYENLERAQYLSTN